MKVASLKSSNKDGELIVVSQDLKYATKVLDIASSLQEALDHWDKSEYALKQRYAELNRGQIKDCFAFDPNKVTSPLPRAYQWADCSAYVNHVQLIRKSRGMELPENLWSDPLIYQGGSDTFLGPRDPIMIANPDWEIDFEAEVAVILKDVPMGVSENEAKDYIVFLMLVNDISLRKMAQSEIAKGMGFFNCKPSSSFTPVAITADELKEAFDGDKVHLPIVTHYNDSLFGQPNAGVDMIFGFPKLIAHAAKTRALAAGTIIGSGTVSNNDKSKGCSCIIEKRTLETLEFGKAKTPYMQFGDSVRIEMFDNTGDSLFGAIDQTVIPYHRKAPKK